jgi:NMDA receptor-regulated protein 1
MAALFTKDGDQVNNLYDMQCTWYEIECGRAWLRQHQYGKVITVGACHIALFGVAFECSMMLLCRHRGSLAGVQ